MKVTVQFSPISRVFSGSKYAEIAYLLTYEHIIDLDSGNGSKDSAKSAQDRYGCVPDKNEQNTCSVDYDGAGVKKSRNRKYSCSLIPVSASGKPEGSQPPGTGDRQTLGVWNRKIRGRFLMPGRSCPG